MGTGDTVAGIAAARLALLAEEFITVRRSPDPAARPSRPVTPSVPLNLAIVDYMAGARDEVVARTQRAVPEATPAPGGMTAVYDWCERETAHLMPLKRRALDAMLLRQSLEHALAAGDDSVLGMHSCPGCGCWGLFWRPGVRRAACANKRCRDEESGLTSTWSLAQLAHHEIAGQLRTARCAT